MSNISHPIPPLFDKNSRILILGSFPSVKSREEGFFYGHKQNRFWRVISEILGYPLPSTVGEKKKMLLSSGIALWDVISSCEIVGSSDSSIKNVMANDLSVIFDVADIRKIYLNGKTAEKYFDRFFKKTTPVPAVTLPSTSPANAVYRIEGLIAEWKRILEE